MYKVSQEAVQRARNGEGPTIIEIETYRYLGHFQGDPELYRDKEEVPALRQADPIQRLRRILLEELAVSEEEIRQLEETAIKEVDAAYQFARESEYPRPEAALEDVFSS
jgi:pyruvate dehydrogenase E1 component alpha subunit